MNKKFWWLTGLIALVLVAFFARNTFSLKGSFLGSSPTIDTISWSQKNISKPAVVVSNPYIASKVASSGVPASIPSFAVSQSGGDITTSGTFLNAGAGLKYTSKWYDESLVKGSNGFYLPPKITLAGIQSSLASSVMPLAWSTKPDQHVVLTPYYKNKWITVVYMIQDSDATTTIVPGKNIDDYAIVRYYTGDLVASGQLIFFSSPATPLGTALMSQQGNVSVMKFNVSAVKEDVRLDKLVLTELIGQSNPANKYSNFMNARLFRYYGSDSDVQVGNTVSQGIVTKKYGYSTVRNDFTFNGLNYVVPAGVTLNFKLVIDIPDYGPVNSADPSAYDFHQPLFLDDASLYPTGTVQATGLSSGVLLTTQNGGVMGIGSTGNNTVQGNVFTIVP